MHWLWIQGLIKQLYFKTELVVASDVLFMDISSQKHKLHGGCALFTQLVLEFLVDQCNLFTKNYLLAPRPSLDCAGASDWTAYDVGKSTAIYKHSAIRVDSSWQILYSLVHDGIVNKIYFTHLFYIHMIDTEICWDLKTLDLSIYCKSLFIIATAICVRTYKRN